MTTTQENLKAIKERLAHLRARTTEKGCTEAEAMAAAKAAARIMENYGLSESDVADLESGKTTGDFDTAFSNRARSLHGAAHCAQLIGELTGTIIYSMRIRREGVALAFFGQEADRLYAEYLYDLIAAAMDYEWSKYLKSPDRPKNINARTLKPSFTCAMAKRVNERLEALKPPPSLSTGTALVIRKQDIARREFSKSGPKLNKARPKRIRVHEGALAAGRAAGDKVALSKGVTGGRTSSPALT